MSDFPTEAFEAIKQQFREIGLTQEGTKEDTETTVFYLIEAGDHNTKLTLIHSGFPEENQTYTNISGGWLYILDALKTSLEKE